MNNLLFPIRGLLKQNEINLPNGLLLESTYCYVKPQEVLATSSNIYVALFPLVITDVCI